MPSLRSCRIDRVLNQISAPLFLSLCLSAAKLRNETYMRAHDISVRYRRAPVIISYRNLSRSRATSAVETSHHHQPLLLLHLHLTTPRADPHRSDGNQTGGIARSRAGCSLSLLRSQAALPIDRSGDSLGNRVSYRHRRTRESHSTCTRIERTRSDTVPIGISPVCNQTLASPPVSVPLL